MTYFNTTFLSKHKSSLQVQAIFCLNLLALKFKFLFSAILDLILKKNKPAKFPLRIMLLPTTYRIPTNKKLMLVKKIN